jgi:hypothetical protein
MFGWHNAERLLTKNPSSDKPNLSSSANSFGQHYDKAHFMPMHSKIAFV